MKVNPCNKCKKRPDVGSSYSRIGEIIKGDSFVKCDRCSKCSRVQIMKSVYRAEQAAIEIWNSLNPLPDSTQ